MVACGDPETARVRSKKLLLPALLLAPAGCSEPRETPPNVLLISVDMLRADHLSCYGYERATSPHVDRIAREGTLFEEHVSSTSWTLPAHAALFTGLPDAVHGCTDSDRRLDERFTTLAEQFAAAGYETAGWFAGPYLHPVFGFGQGFERYENCTSYAERTDSAPPAEWERTQEINHAAHRDVTNPTVLARFQSWFGARSRRPFFAFVHLWDAHYDFIPPPPYDRRFDPDYDGAFDGRTFILDPRIEPRMAGRDLEHLIALYDGEIAWTDEHVGRIRALLEEAGVLERTIVVVTADHGTEFFEHGQKGHRKSLYDEVVHIPLVVRWPERVPAGLRIPRQTRLVDVAPTLLELCGVAPLPDVMGRSMAAVFADPAAPLPEHALSELDTSVHAMRSLRTAGWKLLHNRVKGLTCAVDLARDPGETRIDCTPGSPLVQAGIQALAGVDAELSALGAVHAGEAARPRVPPEVKRQLDDLGYTQGSDGAEPR